MYDGSPTPGRLITRVNDAAGRGQLAPLRDKLIAGIRRSGLQVSDKGSGPRCVAIPR